MLRRATIYVAGINVGLRIASLITDPTNGAAWFALAVFVGVGVIGIWFWEGR